MISKRNNTASFKSLRGDFLCGCSSSFEFLANQSSVDPNRFTSCECGRPQDLVTELSHDEEYRAVECLMI